MRDLCGRYFLSNNNTFGMVTRSDLKFPGYSIAVNHILFERDLEASTVKLGVTFKTPGHTHPCVQLLDNGIFDSYS